MTRPSVSSTRGQWSTMSCLPATAGQRDGGQDFARDYAAYPRARGLVRAAQNRLHRGWHRAEEFTLIHRAKKVEFIEQFNEKLLVKQEGENLEIMSTGRRAVSTRPSSSPRVPLSSTRTTTTFRGRQVMVWNFAGEPVNVFEDHSLWHADTNTSNVFITSAQDYIVSYCRPRVARVVADSTTHHRRRRGLVAGGDHQRQRRVAFHGRGNDHATPS